MIVLSDKGLTGKIQRKTITISVTSVRTAARYLADLFYAYPLASAKLASIRSASASTLGATARSASGTVSRR